MRWVTGFILLLAALAVGGCAPRMHVDRGPTLDRDGQPRSLALSPAGVPGHADAWWSDRNDLPRAAAVQPDGLVYDLSVQRVYDRLHSHGDRVHDRYHESSYKRRVRQYAP